MPFRRAIVQRPYTGNPAGTGIASFVPSIAVDGMDADVDAVDASIWWDRRPNTTRGTVAMGEFSASGSTGPAVGFTSATVYMGELRAARPRLQPGQNRIDGTLGTTRLPGVFGAGLTYPTSTPTATAPRSFVFRNDAVTRVWRSVAFPSALVLAQPLELGGDVVASAAAVLVAGAGAVQNGADAVAAAGAVVVSAAGAFTLGGDVVVVSGAAIVSAAGASSQTDDGAVASAAIVVDGVVFSLQSGDVVFAEGSTEVANVDTEPLIVLVTSVGALAAVVPGGVSVAVGVDAVGAAFVIAEQGATFSVVPNGLSAEVIP